MQRFCLTSWTTIRGGSGVGTITQGEPTWLDLGGYDDATFYLQVSETSGATMLMTYQTSPSKDDASFQPIVPAFALVTGARAPDRVLAKYTSIARWVRWQITGTNNYEATFQIWVAAD